MDIIKLYASMVKSKLSERASCATTGLYKFYYTIAKYHENQ
ncbi:MAG: hypothetical protein PF436_02680 [Prolixibacteraceae bacterium]|nr:hypothetical protein [Prolixibacteraceae bacterium]